MTACVLLPLGTPKETVAEIKRLNPGLVTIETLPPASGETAIVKTEIHAKEAGVWLDLLPGLLAAGATILCPAAWIPFVSGAIRIGLPKVRALIEGTPTQERWTLVQILALEAEVEALPDPST